MQSSLVLSAVIATLAAPAVGQAPVPPSNGSIPIYDITPRLVPNPVPTESPTPRPTATPRTVASPTPLTTPTATPTPRVRPSPSPTPTASPTPRATPTEAADPVPATAPTPTPVSSPDVVPAPAATDVAVPEQAANADTGVAVAPDGFLWWPWLVGAAILAGVLGFVVGRRRSAPSDGEGDVVAEPTVAEPPLGEDPVTAASSEPAPLPVVATDVQGAVALPTDPAEVAAVAGASTPTPVTAPVLEFSLLPLRVGMKGDDAVLDFDLTVVNPADMPVERVSIATLLLSANPRQDEQIAAFLARDGGPAIEPFPVAPRDGRRLEASMALPRTGINVVTANERPFFVPVLAIDARYRWADGREARTSAAFVIGPHRTDSPKLAPVFLDRGERVNERLEARLHGEVRRS